jgi:hypothetical protein
MWKEREKLVCDADEFVERRREGFGLTARKTVCLSLLYSATHPDDGDRVALVRLGPLDDELGVVASANLMKSLSPAKRREHSVLDKQLDRAVKEKDLDRMSELHMHAILCSLYGALSTRREKATQFIERLPSGRCALESQPPHERVGIGVIPEDTDLESTRLGQVSA